MTEPRPTSTWPLILSWVWILGTVGASVLFLGAMLNGSAPAGLPFGVAFWVLVPTMLLAGVLPSAILAGRSRSSRVALLRTIACIVVLVIELGTLSATLRPGS